ncbi:MAG: hypothetical protein GY913_18630 [Proteobacteria bacterium]|nr:hypothetical protein [Pseudomonadota bacterium]MCP4918927.1 hypothetical protein [Pseudomonadota bacterium]
MDLKTKRPGRLQREDLRIEANIRIVSGDMPDAVRIWLQKEQGCPPAMARRIVAGCVKERMTRYRARGVRRIAGGIGGLGLFLAAGYFGWTSTWLVLIGGAGGLGVASGIWDLVFAGRGEGAETRDD